MERSRSHRKVKVAWKGQVVVILKGQGCMGRSRSHSKVNSNVKVTCKGQGHSDLPESMNIIYHE